MIALHPSASFSATLRVHLDNRPGSFARLAEAIGEAGGLLDAIDLVRVESGKKVRDVTVLAADEGHIARIERKRRRTRGRGGRPRLRPDLPHPSRRQARGRLEDPAQDARRSLHGAHARRRAHLPRDRGGSREGLEPHRQAEHRRGRHRRQRGSRARGHRPRGSPARDGGKAILFKEFGGIDAWPLCLATKDPDEIVRAVCALAPVFGGINLEDISAPRCFEVEARLREELDIPVFHDDQHGTAIVVLAALLNALAVVGKRLEDIRVVVTGAGAAGAATARMLVAAGAGEIVCCDRHGTLYPGRTGIDSFKADLAATTNPRGLRCSADEALSGADVYIGLSGPGAVTLAGIRTMGEGAVVFAMANPTPEIAPEEIQDVAAVIGTGRSDYPNQINNVLAFPGVFRGALDVRVTTITPQMEIAAAHALASVVKPEHVEAEYLIPSVFDQRVAPAVASAVAEAAEASGAARKRHTTAEAAVA